MSDQKPNDIEKLQQYYSLRAKEYERIYDFDEPLRREELNAVESLVAESFGGRDVLEIACGSGYWTQALAEVAASVRALDGSQEMLNVAQAKNYRRPIVEFELFDVYRLLFREDSYNAALAGFWLSHVPKLKLESFLKGLHDRLQPQAVVLFFDNNLVEGMGGPLINSPDSVDTFKNRTLIDGSQHKVIKNYFTSEDLHEIFSPYGQSLEVTMGRWYWSVLYQTR